MTVTAKRYLVLLLLLAAAAVSYAVGFTAGFWLLIGLGAAFELAFWFQLFSRRRRH